MTLPPADKTALRREGLARRDALPAPVREAASRAIAAALVALPALARARVVAGYWPLRSEVDVRPALETLHARGARVALPAVVDPRLVFRAWSPGAPLAAGAFGVSAPGPEAETLRPDAVIVPLARFDRRGHRIGYGKGHYDRALAELDAAGPVVAVGVAFAVQETARVPAEPHDRPLDLIVTEEGIMHALPEDDPR